MRSANLLSVPADLGRGPKSNSRSKTGTEPISYCHCFFNVTAEQLRIPELL
jgi:hypothetical protein